MRDAVDTASSPALPVVEHAQGTEGDRGDSSDGSLVCHRLLRGADRHTREPHILHFLGICRRVLRGCGELVYMTMCCR